MTFRKWQNNGHNKRPVVDNQKTKTPIQIWATDLIRRFSKEDIQMAKKAHEKILNIIIREMQIKTVGRD